MTGHLGQIGLPMQIVSTGTFVDGFINMAMPVYDAVPNIKRPLFEIARWAGSKRSD